MQGVFLQFVTDERWRWPWRKRYCRMARCNGTYLVVIWHEGAVVQKKHCLFIQYDILYVLTVYHERRGTMNGIVSEIVDTLAFVCSICIVIVCCHFPIG